VGRDEFLYTDTRWSDGVSRAASNRVDERGHPSLHWQSQN